MGAEESSDDEVESVRSVQFIGLIVLTPLEIRISFIVASVFEANFDL